MSQLYMLKMTLWISLEGCWWENEVLFSQTRNVKEGVRQMETCIMSSKDLWEACAPKLKYLQSSEIAVHKL